LISAASIIPGVVVLFVFLSAATVARAIYEERKTGSLRRLLAAPLTRSEMMLGKMTPIWLLTMVQIVVIFAVGAFVLPALGLGRLGIGQDPFAWGCHLGDHCSVLHLPGHYDLCPLHAPKARSVG